MKQFQISGTIMFTEMLDAQYTRNADANTQYFVACNRLFNEEQVAAINKTNNKDASITTARAIKLNYEHEVARQADVSNEAIRFYCSSSRK